MTGEIISDLLKPLIGQSGTIYMVMAQTGQFGFTTAENKKRTGVEIRPDGLVRIERENGWAVLDPAGVVAVVWSGDTDSSPGQFL
jgi:hypothetical protein